MSEKEMPVAACYDCGRAYGGVGWMDAVLENAEWAKISPSGDEGGILCISCMAARCERQGLTPRLWITSGPFVAATEHETYMKGWDLGFKVGSEVSQESQP